MKWFERKTYGYGWTPVTWQGWLSTFLVILSIVFSGLSLALDPSLRVIIYSCLQAVISVFLLILLARATGPAPKWQWGVETSSVKAAKKKR